MRPKLARKSGCSKSVLEWLGILLTALRLSYIVEGSPHGTAGGVVEW